MRKQTLTRAEEIAVLKRDLARHEHLAQEWRTRFESDGDELTSKLAVMHDQWAAEKREALRKIDPYGDGDLVMTDAEREYVRETLHQGDYEGTAAELLRLVREDPEWRNDFDLYWQHHS